MSKKLFCVYDTISKTASSPVVAVNDADAIRQYHAMLTKSPVDPGHLRLVGLGDYNDDLNIPDLEAHMDKLGMYHLPFIEGSVSRLVSDGSELEETYAPIKKD